MIALLVSFALIIAYIAVRFEYKMGVCAIIALLHDIIIVVGVVLETIKQIESQMAVRYYKGFLND